MRVLECDVNASDSTELIREFADSGSESAFGELVRRHLDLVYSVALRICQGDGATARDVSQQVFTDLARRSRTDSSCSGPLHARSLAGWLYQHTTFTACKVIRAEVRRRAREETAMKLQAPAGDPDWDALAPVLESALTELPEPDRDAVVLRFFEKATYARVGAVLGVREDAARMRVDRALDKLRDQLARRGVTSTASALGASLAAHGVTPAPADLATVVVSQALVPTTATTATAAIGTLTKPLTLGIAAAVSMVSLLIAFQFQRTATQQQAQYEGRLAAQNTALQQLEEELARLHAQLARLNETGPSSERAELLRLRGETARLRRELAERPTPSATNAPTEKVAPSQIEVSVIFSELPEAVATTWVRRDGTTILTEAQTKSLVDYLEKLPGVDVLSGPKVVTLSGRSAELSIGDPDQAGLMLEVLPEEVAPGQLALEFRAGYREPPSAETRLVDKSRARLLDGQTVVLHQPARDPSDKSRSLLVLISPVLIDPAGRRTYPLEPERHTAAVPNPEPQTGSSAPP